MIENNIIDDHDLYKEKANKKNRKKDLKKNYIHIYSCNSDEY